MGVKGVRQQIGTNALSGWMLVTGGIPILAWWLAFVAPPDLCRG
ncbi:MAG: hypothetical protein R3D03_10985 [Geminicoccaceae bacterium]